MTAMLQRKTILSDESYTLIRSMLRRVLLENKEILSLAELPENETLSLVDECNSLTLALAELEQAWTIAQIIANNDVDVTVHPTPRGAS